MVVSLNDLFEGQGQLIVTPRWVWPEAEVERVHHQQVLGRQRVVLGVVVLGVPQGSRPFCQQVSQLVGLPGNGVVVDGHVVSL
ncbi:MAG: hypothetical protein Q9O62_13595 [Ardenticatenia bacterium]|nr:hypothetical protein [Ardenticatenia bacterium]